jgi:hypothetical protein
VVEIATFSALLIIAVLVVFSLGYSAGFKRGFDAAEMWRAPPEPWMSRPDRPVGHGVQHWPPLT